MISREVAVRLTATNFPHGPEKLAEKIGVEILSSPLVGVEGWCIQGLNTATIRINSTSSPFRQRFTLAHELAHLVLGTKPDIATEPFRSDRQEECDADQLASEFLIPIEQVNAHFRGHLPIDAKTLKRLAKAARVSPVMAACRVVNAAVGLGLKNAGVFFFAGGIQQWSYSPTLRFDESEGEELLKEAMKCYPNLVRLDNSDGNVVVGSMIDAQDYQVLLVQLLPEEEATKETQEERIRSLASELFDNDSTFRPSIAGSLGVLKGKCQGKNLSEAVDFFYTQYVGVKYSGDREKVLLSTKGREYIRLYLERWFHDA